MGASRGADKMDVLALVRVDECQPVASDDFLDLLWRTAKDELAFFVGCAASAGYTQQGDEPEQRSTLRFISCLHPMHHACKTNLPAHPSSG